MNGSTNKQPYGKKPMIIDVWLSWNECFRHTQTVVTILWCKDAVIDIVVITNRFYTVSVYQ